MPLAAADDGPGAERQLAAPPMRLLPPDWSNDVRGRVSGVANFTVSLGC